MVLSVDDLQVGEHGGAVQGGGHLADAAAQLLDSLAVEVRACLLEATGCRPLSHDPVIGEGLSRQQDGVVAVLAGQSDVVDAGGGAGHVGAVGAQPVLEQVLGQVLGGDVRCGQLQADALGLALFQPFDSRGRFLFVKADAGGGGHDGVVVLGVQRGILGLGVDLFIHLVDVQRLRL